MTYPGGPPYGRQHVLNQAIRIYDRHWLPVLAPGSWPAALAACPRDARGRLVASRAVVLNIGQRAAAAPTGQNCERAMAAAAAWGAGTNWRAVVRAQRTWDHPQALLRSKLQTAVQVLVGQGAVAAYQLLREGPGRIDGLGPAFATKFLYFVGYGTTPIGPPPLILDRYVARGLNRLLGWTWPDTGWTVRQYATYLDWAVAEAVGQSPITSEDEAEFRIWRHGR